MARRKGRRMRHYHPYQRTEPRAVQAQLELPLGCSPSASDARLQNLEQSKRQRLQRLQARVAKFQEMRERRGTVPVSCSPNSGDSKKRQGHHFVLTDKLSSLIDEANVKRWTSGHGAALPPLDRRSHALASEGRAHVRRRGSRRLPSNPLGRH